MSMVKSQAAGSVDLSAIAKSADLATDAQVLAAAIQQLSSVAAKTTDLQAAQTAIASAVQPAVTGEVRLFDGALPAGWDLCTELGQFVANQQNAWLMCNINDYPNSGQYGSRWVSASAAPSGNYVYVVDGLSNGYGSYLYFIEASTGKRYNLAPVPYGQGDNNPLPPQVVALNDTQVLVLGGGISPVYWQVYRFTRTSMTTGYWEQMPGMPTYIRANPIVRLLDGRLLSVGGYGTSNNLQISACYLMDPATYQWTPTGSLSEAVEGPAVSLLPSGKVVRWGGWNGSASSIDMQVWDPSTGLWSAPVNGGQGANGAGFSFQTNFGCLLLASDGSSLLSYSESTGTLSITNQRLPYPLSGTTGWFNNTRMSDGTYLVPRCQAVTYPMRYAAYQTAPQFRYGKKA